MPQDALGDGGSGGGDVNEGIAERFVFRQECGVEQHIDPAIDGVMLLRGINNSGLPTPHYILPGLRKRHLNEDALEGHDTAK